MFKVDSSSTLLQVLNEQLASGVPLIENPYRYGSESWCRLLCLAREQYDAGLISELSEEDYTTLEGDAGETAIFEGREIILDAPEVNHDRPGWYVVHTRANGVVTRIEFEAD